MSCDNDKTYEPCSCGCGGSSDCTCDCNECAPVNCIEQAIRDALATLQEQLEALVKRAEDAAKTSEDAAAASAASAAEAKDYRDAAELAATTATDALKTITDVAVSLEATAKKLQEIAYELATAIAGIAVVTWYYTAVSEGQTVIPIPDDKNALAVQCIYIEGARQEPGRGFVFDKTTMTITLTEGIPLGLEISIILGTYSDNPTDFPQTLASNNGASLVGTASGNTVQEELDGLTNGESRTIQEVARTYNTKNSQVILSSDTASVLDPKTIIYDVNQQKAWGLPSGIPTGATVVSVAGDQLTYKVGTAQTTVTLVTVPGSTDRFKQSLAAVDGISLIGSATYAQIRSYTGSNSIIQCIGRANIFDGANGLFALVAGDTTSVDDDGVILVDANNRRWKRVDLTRVCPEWWGAKADGVTASSPAINKAITYLKNVGGGLLSFLRGTYLCGTALDLKGAMISMQGEGMLATVLKATFTGESLVDLYETSDARLSPIAISDMTLNGNATIARVMKLRYRHYTKFSNVLFTGGGTAAAYAVDAWLNTYTNCGFESSNFGLHLDGANHRSACYSCSFQGNTSRNIVVRSNSAAGDGNIGLYFANCDVEFSSGLGIDFQGSDATFDCCYLGENLSNSVIQVYSGTVRINGGVIFFGYTNATYLAFMTGGNLIIDGATINGQTYGSLPILGQGRGGKFAIKNSPLNFPLAGDPSMVGDLLLSLNDKKVFAPRLGIDYASYAYNATVTDTVSGSARTVTAATVPGPSPVIGVRAGLTDMQWKAGEPWAFVITYASNVSLIVKVSASAGGSGNVAGTLPATGGAVKTAVIYTTNAVRTSATVLEIYRDGTVAVGHTMTIHSVSFGDSRAMGTEFGSNGGNIYKF